MAVLAEGKTTVSEYYAANHRFPTNTMDFGVNMWEEIPADNVYMLDVDWSGNDNEPVYIIAGVPGSIWGGSGTHAFSLSGSTNANGRMTWTCLAANPHGSWPLVPVKYLPASCRG